MSGKIFKDALNNQTIIDLTDELLKYEKMNKSNKKHRFEFLKAGAAVAAIALFIGVINLAATLPNIDFPQDTAVIGVGTEITAEADITVAIPEIYSTDSVEVKNEKEFMQAIENNIAKIYINGTVNVSDNEIYVMKDQIIYIMPDAVLNIYSPNFRVFGDIINDGVINIDSRGRLCMMFRIPTKFGVINAPFSKTSEPEIFSGSVEYLCGEITVSEMNYLLNGDLPFSTVALIGQPGCVVTIDEDYTLPKDKFLWLNLYTTLKIAENATFTANGKVETFYEVINEGKIIGDIDVHPQADIIKNSDVGDDAGTCVDWIYDILKGNETIEEAIFTDENAADIAILPEPLPGEIVEFDLVIP